MYFAVASLAAAEYLSRSFSRVAICFICRCASALHSRASSCWVVHTRRGGNATGCDEHSKSIRARACSAPVAADLCLQVLLCVLCDLDEVNLVAGRILCLYAHPRPVHINALWCAVRATSSTGCSTSLTKFQRSEHEA